MRTWLMVALLSVVVDVYAQENFRTGKLISLTGDTLSGQIDDRMWTGNPDRVRFRKADGSVAVYAPSEVKGFLVRDEKYISKLVKYDSTSNKVQQLPETRLPAFKEAQIFARVLFAGELSLLEFQDKGERRHYFIFKGNTIEELILHPFVVRKDGVIAGTAENKMYLGQLANYLRDCSTIAISEKLPYTREALTKVVAQYAVCRGEGLGGAKAGLIHPDPTVRFGIVGNASSEALGSQADRLTGYGGGLFITTSPGKRYGSYTFRLEAIYNTLGTWRESRNFGGSPVYTNYSYNYLQVTLLGRFRFEKSTHQSFISVGLANTFDISYSKNGTDPYPFNYTKAKLFGLTAGLGTHLGNLVPEVRAETSLVGLNFRVLLSYPLVKSGPDQQLRK